LSNRRNTLQQGFYDRILLAIIAEVDHVGGFVSIQFLDQVGFRDKVPIPVIAMSRDAWCRFIPQVDDVVFVGLRPDDSAVILGWLPYGYGKRVGNFDTNETNAAGGGGPEMHQVLKPGEFDIRAKGGGYLRLNAIGDVLIMSLAGRVQMFGREGFTEVSQLGLKLTDGKSWLRFGAPFRFFPGISTRELPTSGAGLPLNKPSDLRERDMRLYDQEGNLLVQESLGTVIDETGVIELSGTSGSGAAQDVGKTIKGDIASATKFASDLADPAVIAKGLSGVSDHIKELATQFVGSIGSAVTGIISGVSTVYSSLGKTTQYTSIAQTVADVKGIVTGAGAIADGLDQLRGIGDVGNKLRYRLLINKGGKQVACYDIDSDGGIVLSSESPVGTTLNANKGGLVFYAKKGLKMIAKGLAATFESAAFTTTKDTRLIAGRKQIRTAGTDIVDTAQNITQAAVQEVAIGGGTSVKLVVGTTSVELAPGTVTVNGSGTVNINGGGTVNISGAGLVAITGALVTIN
jgi:hypothetical protein